MNSKLRILFSSFGGIAILGELELSGDYSVAAGMGSKLVLLSVLTMLGTESVKENVGNPRRAVVSGILPNTGSSAGMRVINR